uniref:GRIP and coiled-coil domain-containing protein 1-like n=1 Tax=Saccoglossus kowalevskii TaxID=10224 RepID=A0ABM0MHU2_SACKO
MDRATRKDLLETIEKQKDQIARYEKRLRDVVYAYKSLCTEKEALEASVQILSQKQRQETINVVKENEDENNGSEDDDNKCDDPLQADAQASSASSENKNTNSLQLSTITNALATVSAEKSKMEQNFQADKKKMR